MEGVLVCVLCVDLQEEEGSSVAGIDVWQISRWKFHQISKWKFHFSQYSTTMEEVDLRPGSI